MVAQNAHAAPPVWEYRRPGESEQDEQWREASRWLARTLGTAHGARFLALVERGSELWSAPAGEGNAYGERRLVWHDKTSERLWCEQCGSIRCAHSGSVLIALDTHGEQRVVHQEPTREEIEANAQVWREAAGWPAQEGGAR